MSSPVILCVLSALLLLGPSAQASLPPPDTSYNFLMMLLLLGPSVQASLPPPDTSYNFLMMLPATSISHRNVFMPLVAALTQRGHKITMVTPLPPANNNPNVTYINHGLLFDPTSNNMFEIGEDMSDMINLFNKELPALARDFYNVPIIQKLYENRKQFDLIIFDWSFNEFSYPFAHEQSFISITTSGVDPVRSAKLGNLLNPAYVSSPLIHYKLPMSFVERINNIFFHFQLPVMWDYLVIPKMQVEVDKHFPNLPSLLEIESNMSLSLFNSHYTLDSVLPLLPTQVEIGGMHCRPGLPLPKNIHDFLSGKDEVIYFSLGSVTKGTTMPASYQDILVATFAKLPYKILWKFEADRNDTAENILIQKWMPQQDILAHPNVKLFISHCGLLSTHEAMYHAKPVLGLPIYADQPKNAAELQNKGIGRMLRWEDLSQELLLKEITELMTNPSYMTTMKRLSANFRDQLQPPVERAVYWSEYVIRHQGATHLRSPELDLTWRELLHLDILFVLHVLLYLLYRMVKSIVRMCCGDRKSSTKKKRE